MMTQIENGDALLESAKLGDREALGRLLLSHRDQLVRIVKIRMDVRVQSRVDPSDVVQDTYVEATRRFSDFAKDPKMDFFLWLRFLTIQKLIQIHRFHLGAQARDAGREISINRSPAPQATSAVLAAQLLGSLTSPTRAAVRQEDEALLEKALNEMDEIDREVLVLRHFERLSVNETAQVLNLSESGASSRYFRALGKLKKIMT